MWKVTIWEFERGWGRRVGEVREFTDHPEAWKFYKDFNSENTATVVPDWYMGADEPYFVEAK